MRKAMALIYADARQNLNDLHVNSGDENFIKNWVDLNLPNGGTGTVSVSEGNDYLVTASFRGGTLYIDKITLA